MLKIWDGGLMSRHQNVKGLGWRADEQAPECLKVLVGGLMSRHQNV
jgi:hypothetical protein